MKAQVERITPKMAREYLERNMPSNRRINREIVRRYARIMKCGGWELTHQGIAFDSNGTLIDGQHRLKAIIEADTPVDMLVTVGVEHTPGDALSIDVGAKRTLLNIMQISGVEDKVYKVMGKVVVAYYRWKKPGGYRPDPVEVIDYIERHYDDLARLYSIFGETCRNSDRMNKNINGFVGAAMLSALYRGESEEALRQFARVYRFNDVSGCANYNPRHVLNLRDWVRDRRDSAEMFARVESAISAFANNKGQLYLKYDRYPYIAEMDA